MAPPAPATTPTTTRPPATPTTQGSVGGPATATPTTADDAGGAGPAATSTTGPRRLDEHHERTWLVGPRCRATTASTVRTPCGVSARRRPSPWRDDGGSPVGVVVAVLVALGPRGRSRDHREAPALARGRGIAVRLPRALHPGAWWLWALGLATAASRTTNPLLLGAHRRRGRLRRGGPAHRRAVGAGLQGVPVPRPGRDRDPGRVPHAARRRSTAPTSCSRCPRCPCPTRPRASASAAPCRSRACSPRSTTGCASPTLLLCVGAANVLANPKRLLKAVPAALHEIGVAVTVALSVAPQLIESGQRVRRGPAAARRAGPRGSTSFREVALPVMTDALDRSLLLAAAMDARGLRPHRPRWPAPHRAATGGAAARRAGRRLHRHLRAARQHRPAAARPADAAGRRRGRVGRDRARAAAASPRSRYRPDPWQRRGVGASPAIGRGWSRPSWSRSASSIPTRPASRRSHRCVARRCPCVPARGDRCSAAPAGLARPAGAAARRPPSARGRRATRGARRVIRFEHVTITYADAPSPALRDVDLTIAEGELCVVVGPHRRRASRRFLGAINGLVPHFTGGHLAGRVVVDGRDTRTHPPRDLADVVGVVGPGPAGRLRHRHRRGGARLRDGAARRPGRRDAQARRGDARPARHRRAARPRPAHALGRPAAARRHRLGAHRRTRASSCSTSRRPRSTPPPPRRCSPPSPGSCTTSASPS